MLRIRLHRPARGIARGQAAVIYDGEIVLGSATITQARSARGLPLTASGSPG